MTPAIISSWRRRSCQSRSITASSARLLQPVISTFGRVDSRDAAADGAGDLDKVRQIVLALGIGVADARQQIERLAAVDRHQAAVAPFHGTLGICRILFLADGDQFAVLDEQAAVAGRPVGVEADDDHIAAFGKALDARP